MVPGDGQASTLRLVLGGEYVIRNRYAWSSNSLSIPAKFSRERTDRFDSPNFPGNAKQSHLRPADQFDRSALLGYSAGSPECMRRFPQMPVVLCEQALKQFTSGLLGLSQVGALPNRLKEFTRLNEASGSFKEFREHQPNCGGQGPTLLRVATPHLVQSFLEASFEEEESRAWDRVIHRRNELSQCEGYGELDPVQA
jgi:hypothetical protein